MAQAETETRLREIDEYAAREAALASAVGSAPALEASAEVAILQAIETQLSDRALNAVHLWHELCFVYACVAHPISQAALEVEREKNAALMAELQSVKVDAELNLQKASAFW
jgi:hypothetical protein